MNSTNTQQKATDPRVQIEELQEIHAALKKRVTALTRNVYLTPAEKREVREIKRRKLSIKDDIQRLTAEMNANQ